MGWIPSKSQAKGRNIAENWQYAPGKKKAEKADDTPKLRTTPAVICSKAERKRRAKAYAERVERCRRRKETEKKNIAYIQNPVDFSPAPGVTPSCQSEERASSKLSEPEMLEELKQEMASGSQMLVFAVRRISVRVGWTVGEILQSIQNLVKNKA